MKKLWGGRFKKEIDARLKTFSYSLLTDQELLCAELSVNEAYVKMLARAGIVRPTEKKRLLAGLARIGKNWKPGDACRLHEKYEDIHTFLQQELERSVGPAAKKLHTGRSRNDLVVTSTRLYIRHRLEEVEARIAQVSQALVQSAARFERLVLPGLTHLKRAQPVLLAHHLLAYVEMFEEDRARLADARKRLNVLPLGSAALAGSALKLDREYLARKLGFDRIAGNSLAAVSDRAFLAEALAAISIHWIHLSRLAEDFILWNSESFGYVELDDAFATGSSLMPQKKNPDLFELIRGKSAIVLGELTGLLALQKGLPLAYNRDLQEDKPGVFRALRETCAALEALAPALESAVFRKEPMRAACEDDGLYATDLLEYLVKRNVPFSEAHTIIGQLVRDAQDRGVALRDLPLKDWKKHSRVFGPDIYSLFDPFVSVQGKQTPGSTHPAKVRAEIRKWKKYLAPHTRLPRWKNH